MRITMTSDQEQPKLENRNSKFEIRNSKPEIRNSPRASRLSNFQVRISSFEFKLAALLMLVLWGGWLWPAYGAERVWEKRFELPPGGHVSVVNVHGSILVEGWDRAEVEATVAMRSKSPADHVNDVQVAVEASSGGVAFHTLYPSGLDTPIRVDYRLRVPRQVRLDELSTLEGDIVIHDVEGSIQARNLHGDIEGINVSGSVVARALTGNILVSLRALPDRLPIQLATINGNVDLMMPPQANASLELSTVAGNILGDYPFQVSSIPGDSTRRAQVGAGGVLVELRTVRGNIRVGQRDEDL
jgi:hypothetical protein